MHGGGAIGGAGIGDMGGFGGVALLAGSAPLALLAPLPKSRHEPRPSLLGPGYIHTLSTGGGMGGGLGGDG